MDRFYYVQVGAVGRGLSNQLGYIISGIMQARLQGKRFVVLSEFYRDFEQSMPCPISEIIDLKALNLYTSTFGVYVIDETLLTYKILSVKYGARNSFNDITDIIKKRYTSSNKLLIPRDVDFNGICGDPLEGVAKTIFIKYEVNGISDTVIYPERPADDIVFDVSKRFGMEALYWIALYDVSTYDEILSHIQFTEHFFGEKPSMPAVMNVIHIRDDDDAINFWGNINSMAPFDYREALTAKYIELIDKHFDKEIPVLVLCYNLESPVVKHLLNNGYFIFHNVKHPENGRETNAILDLVRAKESNGTLICNINPYNYHGSSFSYFLWKQMSATSTKICIDLDEINHPEYVIKA